MIDHNMFGQQEFTPSLRVGKARKLETNHCRRASSGEYRLRKSSRRVLRAAILLRLAVFQHTNFGTRGAIYEFAPGLQLAPARQLTGTVVWPVGM